MAQQNIGDILSDPETMSSIMSLVRELTGEQESAQAQPLHAQLSLAGLDPKYVRIAVSVMDAWSNPDSRKDALLTALTPYLSDNRAAQVTRATQIARVAKAIRALIDSVKEEGNR